MLESAGKRSHRSRSSSTERVRLLQPLLPHPQNRPCSATYSRSQTPESHPGKMVVQDDHIETDPLTNMPRGLVHVTGSEKRLLSYAGIPPSQTIIEIRIRGCDVSIQGPPVWAVPCSPHFYAMHGCGSLPSATDGNLHPQLPRRLAHSGPVRGSFNIAQDPPPQPQMFFFQNFSKSILSPSQRVSFLGTVIDSVQMTATVSAERAMTIQRQAASFKEGTACPLKDFQKMLGLMAAASPVLQLGLLRMWPIQFWLKQRVPSATWHHRRHRITVTWACVSALARWRDPFWLKRGVILDTAHRRKVVTTDASNKGWGALCKGKPTFGL